MSEKWVDSYIFPERYSVSSEGRVRDRRTLKIIKQHPHVRGYLYVWLNFNGQNKKHLSHSLVLISFKGKRPNGAETRHLNGIKTDNRLENLCWGTAQENANDRVGHGNTTKGSSNPASKLSEDQVLKIRDESGFHRVIAKKYGISRTAVTNIKNRKTWKHV